METGEFLEKIKTIKKKGKSVCTAWDGINLVDDVGSIGGFCALFWHSYRDSGGSAFFVTMGSLSTRFQ